MMGLVFFVLALNALLTCTSLCMRKLTQGGAMAASSLFAAEVICAFHVGALVLGVTTP